METRLNEILEYYDTHYSVPGGINAVREELLRNGVEVRGNSFFCAVPIDDVGTQCLLAGTKDRADTWVLKRIIRLIRSGVPVVSVLNGNSDHLLTVLGRFNVQVFHREGDLAFIGFNTTHQETA